MARIIFLLLLSLNCCYAVASSWKFFFVENLFIKYFFGRNFYCRPQYILTSKPGTTKTRGRKHTKYGCQPVGWRDKHSRKDTSACTHTHLQDAHAHTYMDTHTQWASLCFYLPNPCMQIYLVRH